MAGCFSQDTQRTWQTGKELGLDEKRLYQNYQEMAEAEGKRAEGIDFVTIVTPNASHYLIAKAFLENGLNVVCEKPLTVEVQEAQELAGLAERKNLLFGVTYAYTGYPMVKQARELVKNGELVATLALNQQLTAKPDQLLISLAQTAGIPVPGCDIRRLQLLDDHFAPLEKP